VEGGGWRVEGGGWRVEDSRLRYCQKKRIPEWFMTKTIPSCMQRERSSGRNAHRNADYAKTQNINTSNPFAEEKMKCRQQLRAAHAALSPAATATPP
jgi:hypothetical protein